MLITANMNPLDAAIVIGRPTTRIRPTAHVIVSGVLIGRSSTGR